MRDDQRGVTGESSSPRPAARRAAAVLAVLAVTIFSTAAALFGAPAAFAHSRLVSSDPAKDATVATAPARTVLEFNEPLEQQFPELAVTGPDGVSDWAGGPPAVSGNKLTAPLKPLGPAGVYTIRYRVVSADGHPVSGTVPFTLGTPGSGVAAPAPARAPVAAPPPEADPVPLWPWLAGAAVLLGAGFAVATRIASPARKTRKTGRGRS
ncbi:copper resistance CopC family protein [Amycolatopsis nigrescens]|uniref:copper resistance CopC family protein n=1 Tax=Amycolatopsis nigrescens TaxID=381445 RepID=UPI0003673449|nr:copper resistance CopC family protein [Amycolatopsis nigrescens]